MQSGLELTASMLPEKTTLGNELAERLRAQRRAVIRASIDGFHNPASIRNRRGRFSPEGYYLDSFDLAGLINVLLSPLGPNGTRRYRTAIWDFRDDRVVETAVTVAPTNAVLVFDGVFLHRPELRGYWDFSIFLQVDFATALRRAIVRDARWIGPPEQVERRYHARYFPGQRIYLDRCRPESIATS